MVVYSVNLRMTCLQIRLHICHFFHSPWLMVRLCFANKSTTGLYIGSHQSHFGHFTSRLDTTSYGPPLILLPGTHLLWLDLRLNVLLSWQQRQLWSALALIRSSSLHDLIIAVGLHPCQMFLFCFYKLTNVSIYFIIIN